MRYFKIEKDGVIFAVGVGDSGIEIDRNEYEQILAVIHSHPTPPEGFNYRLKSDLTWELYESPSVEGDELATEADYLAALERFGVE